MQPRALTDAQIQHVLRFLELKAKGDYSLDKYARQYGVPKSTMSKLVKAYKEAQ